MILLKEWAISETLNNGWDIHHFHTFLKKSNQKEFLQSQVPFFFAVQAFPRALAILASKIEDSETRFHVIENLFEEHGQGKKEKFHTETFKTFLISLGWNNKLFKNPWITEWINDCLLDNKKSTCEYAAYLAGIEYAYAPISETISKHLQQCTLICDQIHYSKHAELDWEHGGELLDTACDISPDSIDEIKTSFLLGQQDFLKLYNHILIPTAKDFEDIHTEKVSFYYTRESSDIELKVLSDVIYNRNSASILSIASGGEHTFAMLTSETPLNITLIDTNPNQLALCKTKLKALLEHDSYSNEAESYSGKFEKLFRLLRDYAGEDAILDFYCDYNLEEKSYETSKLKFAMNIIFSNENLSIVFGDAATKYTVKSFCEHFTSVFTNAARDTNNCHYFTYDNIMNILKADDIVFNSVLASKLRDNFHLHSLKFINANLKDIDVVNKYDIINISNIGDWMPLDEYRALLAHLKEHLNEGGYIIARKLLGDYILKDEIENIGLSTEEQFDNSYFYEETIIGQKND